MKSKLFPAGCLSEFPSSGSQTGHIGDNLSFWRSMSLLLAIAKVKQCVALHHSQEKTLLYLCRKHQARLQSPTSKNTSTHHWLSQFH